MAWGLLHAIYLIAAEGKEVLFRNVGFSMPESFSKRLRETMLTFLFVDFAWIFFVSKSFKHACHIIWQMTSVFKTSKGFDFGLDAIDWKILALSIIILFIVDCLHEMGKSISLIVERQELWFRWTLCLGIIWVTILFGIYGVGYDDSSFIYFQF